jgi:TolA-binding protein
MPMKVRNALMMLSLLLLAGAARAQDVPGIEICTVEKDMVRRTSCLQSNVDFLKKTMTQAASDSQRKIDAANRQIEALKASVAALQKNVEDLQAAQKKPEPAKESSKDVVKDGSKDAVKDGAGGVKK